MSGYEDFEMQERVIKSFRKMKRDVGQYQLSTITHKYIEALLTNLELYEITYDTLLKVREAVEVANKLLNKIEICNNETDNTVTKSSIETIENIVKSLYDTFWD